MLYTKPINEIAWDHVQTFCEQRISEGANLDYKQDLNESLAKTVAAMANTFGGLILVGVGEDREEGLNKPKLPLSGLDVERGLADRVMGIVLGNITPPIIPETQICISSNKAVVVIRLHESNQAPHAIAKNTKVYVRTGDRNRPEELASLDRIGWLQGRRRKSEELRERLLEKAGLRFPVFYRRARLERRDTEEASRCWLTISACPLYPGKFYRTPPELKEIFSRILVDEYQSNFPPIGIQWIVEDGLITTRAYGDKVQHTELNGFGLYYYKEFCGDNVVTRDGRSTIVTSRHIYRQLNRFMLSAAKFYNSLGYWGLLNLSLALQDISGCAVRPWLGNDEYEDVVYSSDATITLDNIMPVASFVIEKKQIIFALAQRLAWAFGHDLTEAALERGLR